MHSFRVRRLPLALFVALSLLLLACASLALAEGEQPVGTGDVAPSVVGELVAKRTSTSKTWLLSNGMYRNEIFLGPIHFKDAAGAWQDINTTLTADGAYSEYKSAATPVGVTIRDESPGNRPLRLDLDGYVVEINMANSLEDTKIVQGNSARFFGVKHDADLKYEVLDDGVKETILLYSADAPSSYSFSLSHPGLTLAKDSEGNWGLYEPLHQRPLLVLSDVFAFDASQNEAGDPAACNDAQMTVVPGDGQSRISYSLPAAWLSDPQRVFPVSIDPTLTQSTWGDTYVSNLDPDTSHSSYNELKCGRIDASTGKNRALVKFRVTPAEGGSLPTGAYIHDATFKAYQSYLQSGATARRTYVARMTSSWGEASTWNSASPMTWDWIANQTLAQGDWLAIGCPTVVQRWLDGTYANIGFVIYQQEDGSEDGAWYRKFRSSEYSNTDYRPRLVIDYETPSVAASTDSSVYAIGDTVTVISKVSSYYPSDVRVIENGLNRAAGTSGTYRGVMGWFQTSGDVPSGWTSGGSQPNGSIFAYDPSSTYGNDKITMNFSGCSQSVCGGTPGYKRATFQFTVGSNFGNLLDVTPDTYFAMGSGGSNIWTQSWTTQTNSAFNVLAASVDTATYTTQASDWWNVSSGACDDNDHGRGAMTLMWPKVTDAAGYHVYLADGSVSSGNPVYRQVGATIGNGSTLWSSAGTGLYPSDTAISGANWPGGVGGNPFFRATTPSDGAQQQLLQPSGLTGVGLLVSDGSMLYTRRWMAHAGPSTWTKVTLAGATNGTVGPSLSGKDARSAFLLNGILYNGYVTTLVGNNATIEGVRISDGSTQSLTLAAPPLHFDRGSPITTGTNNSILLTSDGTSSSGDSRIFSVAYTRSTKGDGSPYYDGYKIREYATDGSYLGEHAIAMANYTSELVNGIVCDRNFIYLLQWTGTASAHVTKVSTSSWKITNQWSITQGSQGVVSGCFDATNNAMWLGAIDQGKIYKYAGGWKAANDPTTLNLRDNPNSLYLKNGGTGGPYATWTAYDVKVVPVDSNGAEMTAPASGKVAATLDNRSYAATDDPQYTTADFGSWDSHDIYARLNTGSLRAATTDLAIASWGPEAALSRTYESNSTVAGLYAPGWRFAFEQKLTTIDASHIDFTDEGGDVHHFALVGTAWQSPSGFLGRLSQISGVWKITYPDKSAATFDSNGVLQSIADSNGNSVSYGYANGKVVTITAANSQQILLNYSSAKLASATYTATISGQSATRSVTYTTASPWRVTYSYTNNNPASRVVGYGYDANTRMTSVTQLDWPSSGASAVESFTYSSGKLVEIELPDYNATSKPDARVTIAYDVNSATVTRYGCVNDTANQPAQVETDSWSNQTGLLTSQIVSSAMNSIESNTTSFYYAPDRLQAASYCPSANNVDTTLQTISAIDTAGNTVAENDGGVGFTRLTYDSANNCLSQTDPLGHTTINSYDSHGNLTATWQQLNPAGDCSEATASYDSAGRITQIKQLISGTVNTQNGQVSNGVWVQADYSNFAPNGSPQTTVNRSVQLSYGGAAQDLTAYASYDAFGNRLTQTDISGTRVTETDTYDLVGNQLTSTDAMSRTTSRSYDALGNVTQRYVTASGTSVRAGWKQNSYDAMGRTLTETSLLSDANGNPTTQNVTTDTWDGTGNQLTQSDSTLGGQPAKWVYDDRGNVMKQWQEGVAAYDNDKAELHVLSDGSTPAYDSASRPLRSATPDSAMPTVSTYAPAGDLLSESKPDGSFVIRAYDANHNTLAESRPIHDYNQHPDSAHLAITQYSYDFANRLASITKPNGFQTVNSYDALGRLTQAGSSTTVYNTLGWVLRTIDADGVADLRTYDAAGRVISEVKGSQSASVFVYDDDNCLTQQTDPDGRVLQITRNSFGYETEEKHTMGGTVVKDVTIVPDSLGRRTSATDSVSGLAHTWTYPVNTAAGVTETVTCDSGSSATTTIGRDARNQETQRSTNIGTGTNVVHSIDSRDTANRVTQAMLATNNVQHWTYDSSDGNLTRQWGSGFASAAQNTDAYSYDPSTGQKTTDNIQLAYGGTISGSYSYDGNDRLASATINGTTESDTFDTSGNLTQVVVGSTSNGFYYDSANRLTRKDVNGVANTYYNWNTTYGWRTSQGPTQGNQPITYGYAASGRLASYADTTRNLTASYSYDASGQRSKSVVVNGSTTTTMAYAYDGLTLEGLTATCSDGTSWKISYVYDENGQPYAGVYRSPSSSTTPIVFGLVTTDRGDVVELLDINANPFAAYRYDVSGNATPSLTQSTTLITSTLAGQIASRQVLRYAGYDLDSESGLYYCSARFYDPVTRQWISKDPASTDGEETSYQYCGGNPVRGNDPSGLFTALPWPWQQSTAAGNGIDWGGVDTSLMQNNAAYAQYMRVRILYKDLRAWGYNVVGKITGLLDGWNWWAFGMVPDNKPWDIKQSAPHNLMTKDYIRFYGDKISPEDMGNIHYGYTGNAMGLPLWVLRCGSVGASGIWNPILGYQNGLAKALRNARNEIFHDQPHVAQGFRLYGQYGSVAGDHYWVK